MLLDIRNPLLPRLVCMMVEIRRPRALDDILRPRTVHNNLIAEATRLGQHEQIERVSEIVAVDDWVLHWILGLERHRAAGPGREKLGDYREGVFVVDGELVVLLWAAVALCREELDVGLFGGEAHRVAAGFAGCVAPERFVLQTVVEPGECEGAEGEGGEEAGFVFFPLLVGFGEVVVVVDVEVGCEAFFFGFVEHEDNLRRQYTYMSPQRVVLPSGPGGSCPRQEDQLGRECRAAPTPRELRFQTA